MKGQFRWGVATSAYQIEGAADVDGRTDSIWDTFARQSGAIAGGATADAACEHYERMPEDVALLRRLGVNSYRFSVSWPRVQPFGRGRVNPAGVAFYQRLVDEILSCGIDPWITLYHWDLPQELEDGGGWPHRDTAYRFADYALNVHDALGDRVTTWTTLNEPWCVAMYGYADGIHAPGRRDFAAAMRAVHHLLLGHGLAVQRLRAAARSPIELGITLNLTPAVPATDADRDAARRTDGLGIRIFLDPLTGAGYPGDVLADLAGQGARLPIEGDDLDVIAAPIDVLGVNYYFTETVNGAGTAVRDGMVTGMGWPITPGGLTELLLRLSREYPCLPIVITENGAAFEDRADAYGYVHDTERAAFLADHIRAMEAARAQGADVRGYFAWTLLDNFEWSHGYRPRFGLVRVDRDTQRRTPKHSAFWYRDHIARQSSSQP